MPTTRSIELRRAAEASGYHRKGGQYTHSCPRATAKPSLSQSATSREQEAGVMCFLVMEEQGELWEGGSRFYEAT